MGNESDQFKGVNSSELRECYFYITYLIESEIILRRYMKKMTIQKEYVFM